MLGGDQHPGRGAVGGGATGADAPGPGGPGGGAHLPRASVLDTLRFGALVLAPGVARGMILRRPALVALAGLLDVDRRAVGLLQRLRARYGPGPLRLQIPGRSVALVLSPAHVHRILAESPEPFTLASRDKVAALAHFEPDGVLITRGPARAPRRRLNEAVLDTGRPLHRLAPQLATTVRDEVALLMAQVDGAGELVWDDFSRAWWRIVRRTVLGDAARDDDEVTDLLAALRRDANWAYLRRRRTDLHRRLMARLHTYLNAAESGSLASILAATPADGSTRPAGQVPQWLFAFDAAGIAAFRALAMLATHPRQAARARAELAALDLSRPQHLPYLRGCVLESLRLWPTTLAVLRDSTTDTGWDGAVMPTGTTTVILSSFFHRDGQTVTDPDRFRPDRWSGPSDQAALIPFSAGPGACPARDLVLFLTSTLLAAVLHRHELRLVAPRRLLAHRPLPGTLNHTAIRFIVAPYGAEGGA